MTQKADGRYDHTKPWTARPPFQPDQVAKRWQYNGPWTSNEERLTSQALMVMNIPGAEIAQMVRPPLPQIRLFPDRFGFGNRMQPDINDVISLDRVYTEPRVSWYSGSPAGYSGSSTNSLGSV